MAITKEDIKALVYHDKFAIVGGASFDDLSKLDAKLASAVSFGYNPKNARVGSFEVASVLLDADPDNPPANITVQAMVVLKHKVTGKAGVFAEYALDRWATAFDVAKLAVSDE